VSLDELDPMRWATKPKSQQAMDLVWCGAQEGDKRLQEILAGHIKDHVCDKHGRLLLVWCVDQWVTPPWYLMANHGGRAA
jgi:hypothetical protein